MDWMVYIIRCTDGSLYTGITTNVEKRFQQHFEKKGAKYFYSHTPEEIVFTEPGHTRSSATKRELAIKAMAREDKIALFN